MATQIFDQNVGFDSIESDITPINPRLLRRDLCVIRNSDQVFSFQAVTDNGVSIDVQEFNLTVVIQEYELGTTFYPAEIEKVYPIDGIYQLKINHSTKLERSRYVYSIYAANSTQQIRLNYGHILVE